MQGVSKPGKVSKNKRKVTVASRYLFTNARYIILVQPGKYAQESTFILKLEFAQYK